MTRTNKVKERKEMGDKQECGKRSILMLPWLAHGHISPFLQLAKKLTKRNFHIFFCSSSINLDSIKPKISSSTNYSNSIQFVELKLDPQSLFPNLPPHYHTTKGLPPNLLNTLEQVFELFFTNPNNDFLNLLKTLNPDLVLYDFIQPLIPRQARSLGVPAVHFLVTSVAIVSLSFHLEKKRGTGEEFPFPVMYNDLQDCLKVNFMRIFEMDAAGSKMVDGPLQCFELSSCGVVLVKSFRELEGKYIDYVTSVLFKKERVHLVPVGPLIDDDDLHHEDNEMIMKWLEKKETSSTVFVSFGSEFFLSKEEREEVALGLELSNVNFIWVVRFHGGERMELEEALPKGFLQRVGGGGGGEKDEGRGMVVEGWAPQARILGNCNIGGFVSHCGWSSIMESMKYGVPIIAMPMRVDQPINARLVEDVGIGLEVKRSGNGGLQGEEMAKVIKEVMGEKTGECIRKKAKEMSGVVSKNGEEDIDKAVDVLVQLVESKKTHS